jgi:hypothetical protein
MPWRGSVWATAHRSCRVASERRREGGGEAAFLCAQTNGASCVFKPSLPIYIFSFLIRVFVLLLRAAEAMPELKSQAREREYTRLYAHEANGRHQSEVKRENRTACEDRWWLANLWRSYLCKCVTATHKIHLYSLISPKERIKACCVASEQLPVRRKHQSSYKQQTNSTCRGFSTFLLLMLLCSGFRIWRPRFLTQQRLRDKESEQLRRAREKPGARASPPPPPNVLRFFFLYHYSLLSLLLFFFFFVLLCSFSLFHTSPSGVFVRCHTTC